MNTLCYFLKNVECDEYDIYRNTNNDAGLNNKEINYRVVDEMNNKEEEFFNLFENIFVESFL
jgi:hypothetical protein